MSASAVLPHPESATSAFRAASSQPPIAAVQSPQDILQRFEADLKASGCRVEDFKNPDSVTTPAEFEAFKWFPGHGQPTFLNTMRIVPGRTEAERKVSRWHEGIHAIHANTVPATHFTPYNMGNLNIVLSPSSYVLLTLLTERAAATGVSMLGYMDGTPEVRAAVAREAGTVEDFEAAMQANNGRIDVALNRVARESLMKNSNEYMLAWGDRPNNEPLWLRNYYVWQALREYHDCNRFKFSDMLYDSPRPTFVRLGEDDVADIGNILGFNAFGTAEDPDSFFVRNPTLLAKHWRWMQSLNQLLEVPEESDLPTVRQALSEIYGITPEQALDFSKAYKHGDPVIKPHGPKSDRVVPFALGTYRQPGFVPDI